jgi:hypothetical protein
MHWGGFEVALGGLRSYFYFLLSAFYFSERVASRGFVQVFEVRSWMLGVGCWVFAIRNPNTNPLFRPPRGGLGEPWYHHGTVLYP